MNKKIVIITISLAAVIAAFTGVYAYQKHLSSFSGSNVSKSTLGQVDTTSDTYKQYAKLKGDAYDRAFLANMIGHHQGAVDMAKQAQKSAMHQEIKDMAATIISSQENEITDMSSWQKQWDYPASSGGDMTDHSAMGMMDSMAGMTADLTGKTGDEFDKAFLMQMTMHHQSAIDMAAPGETNAKHQEVKTLTKAIITAQSKEITQMGQWQKDWGYTK